MRFAMLLLSLVVAAGCGPAASKTDARLEKFFVEWLQGHGETKIVTDAKGVGLEGNPARLRASIYGSERQQDGGYVVETEFRMTLPGGAEIVEFVAGIGDSEDAAIDDSMVNFTLTTFHVVYKAFLNPNDPHQTIKEVAIGGKPRQVAFGDLFLRGEQGINADLNAMQPSIEDALGGLALSDGPHWIKIVYGQHNKAPTIVAVTLDNNDQLELTEKIKQLDWPKHDGFYMVKQFIVIK
ncbi:MAG: DUF6348 family protein [Planctomycetaceae bacterium]|nr:DUF6348 family protein [Planctomycetaceae bacterium]